MIEALRKKRQQEPEIYARFLEFFCSFLCRVQIWGGKDKEIQYITLSGLKLKHNVRYC